MVTQQWPDPPEYGDHFVSGSCGGEQCSICGSPATHKVGEEIQWDDPNKERHNFTAYVCCKHFRLIFGSAVPCKAPNAKVEADGAASCAGRASNDGLDNGGSDGQ